VEALSGVVAIIMGAGIIVIDTADKCAIALSVGAGVHVGTAGSIITACAIFQGDEGGLRKVALADFARIFRIELIMGKTLAVDHARAFIDDVLAASIAAAQIRGAL